MNSYSFAVALGVAILAFPAVAARGSAATFLGKAHGVPEHCLPEGCQATCAVMPTLKTWPPEQMPDVIRNHKPKVVWHEYMGKRDKEVVFTVPSAGSPLCPGTQLIIVVTKSMAACDKTGVMPDLDRMEPDQAVRALNKLDPSLGPSYLKAVEARDSTTAPQGTTEEWKVSRQTPLANERVPLCGPVPLFVSWTRQSEVTHEKPIYFPPDDCTVRKDCPIEQLGTDPLQTLAWIALGALGPYAWRRLQRSRDAEEALRKPPVRGTGEASLRMRDDHP